MCLLCSKVIKLVKQYHVFRTTILGDWGFRDCTNFYLSKYKVIVIQREKKVSILNGSVLVSYFNLLHKQIYLIK